MTYINSETGYLPWGHVDYVQSVFPLTNIAYTRWVYFNDPAWEFWVGCVVGLVINDVCQYLFDGDSYFDVFYAYKKEYIIFFPKFYGSSL